MTTTAISLPVVTIQHTFPEVIQEVQDGLLPYEKFWVSCYKSSETSIHAKINAELDDHDRNLVNLTTIEEKGNVEVSSDANGVSQSIYPLSFFFLCGPESGVKRLKMTTIYVEGYQDGWGFRCPFCEAAIVSMKPLHHTGSYAEIGMIL